MHPMHKTIALQTYVDVSAPVRSRCVPHRHQSRSIAIVIVIATAIVVSLPIHKLSVDVIVPQ